MGKASIGLRAVVLASAAAMALAACGGSSGGGSGSNDNASGSGKPAKGGTLTFLTLADQIQHLDPQRNYTGEDLAFSSGYLTRTLTSTSSARTARRPTRCGRTSPPTPARPTTTQTSGRSRSRTA